MCIAIYARKSTEQDDRQVQSLEDQIHELSLLAARERIEVSEVFQEARSATKPNNRPEFDRLMRGVAEGRITGVLTWSINRLHRNDIDGGIVSHHLRTGHLEFIRTIERIYRPEDNALLLAIENGMAIAQIQDLKRNVRRGMKGKVERGWHTCKAPVGYLNDAETREIVPDLERFDLVRQGWELLLSGRYSVSAIHRELVSKGLTVRVRARKRPPISRARLHTLFRDRFYLGEVQLKGAWHPGRHKPIISEEEFLTAQNILKELSTGKKPEARSFALSGALWCARCGCAIVGEERVKYYPRTKNRAVYRYYHCSGARGCSSRGIREDDLVALIRQVALRAQIPRQTGEWIKDALVQCLERGLLGSAADLSSLEQRQKEEDRRLDHLTSMRIDGEISANEFALHRSRILERVAEARERGSKARQSASRILHLIYKRVDAAVLAGEISGKGEDPRSIGHLLRVAGKTLLNLVSFELQIDPILEKIAAFEPLRNGSEQPKCSELLPLDSVWWAIVEDLRTTATDQITDSDHEQAATMHERFVLREERKRLRRRDKLIEEYRQELRELAESSFEEAA